MASGQHVNIYGRKGGRGIRPWLLIPKYLCVSVYFGGLITVAVGYSSSESTRHFQELAWLAACWLVAPGALGATLFGILLFAQHPKTFARMRWWRVKMLVLIAMVGPLEVAGFLLLGMLREAFPPAEFVRPGALGLHTVFTIVLAALGAVVVLVIVLGRLKPRLGQKVKSAAGSTPCSSRTTDKVWHP